MDLIKPGMTLLAHGTERRVASVSLKNGTITFESQRWWARAWRWLRVRVTRERLSKGGK